MKGILIDITKCTGCEQCVSACQKAHHLKPEIPVRKLSRDRLSSRRLTTVVALPAGGFAKNIVITRQKRPMNPDGHLLSNSGSDLSMMNVGLKATEDIFPAYRRANSAAITRFIVLVLSYAVVVL